MFELEENSTVTYDKRADIYSFGIVMWELWVRELPYDRNSDKPHVSWVWVLLMMVAER